MESDDSDHSDGFETDSSEEMSDADSSGVETDSDTDQNPALAERDQNLPSHQGEGSYEDRDPGPPLEPAPFRPEHPEGVKELQNGGIWTRQSVEGFTSAGSFFALFFPEVILTLICTWTNKYAREKGPSKPAMYANFYDITEEELRRFFGLLMYMSIVRLPNLSLYWSRQVLFRGLWGCRFMSRFRFNQIQCFFKCSDPDNELEGDVQAKFRCLEEFVKRKCMRFWQPSEHISIDERMVPNKGRYSFRQYIKDKPTKWGMKFWVLADSLNGYTYNFNIYTGRREGASDKGLAYDVVMKLCRPLFNQGYKLFVDNFYSSVPLFKDLTKKMIYSCGTINLNRRHIPTSLKNVKAFAKMGRGAMRWVRQGFLLFLQWVDNKVVSFLSTVHTVKVGDFGVCKRRSKVRGEFRQLDVRLPGLAHDYNMHMGGVDRSDQMIGKYRVNRRTVKFWKTVFYHSLDIARVNAFILFQQFRKDNPSKLQRSSRYAQLDFTIELIKDLAGISNNEDIPVPAGQGNQEREEKHHPCMPEATKRQRNCKRCWRLEQVQRKSVFRCITCESHFCLNQNRNCLLLDHLHA